VATVTRSDGLTDPEGEVMDALCTAVNAFARLPVQHNADLGEFCYAIHQCQGLLATRIARRHYPAEWTNLEHDTGG
jgi:hypothetical protein